MANATSAAAPGHLRDLFANEGIPTTPLADAGPRLAAGVLDGQGRCRLGDGSDTDRPADPQPDRGLPADLPRGA